MPDVASPAGNVRCDLHVHSRFSTDSGNYALKRARLGESFTEPERIYRVALARGMDFVTISDHNTVEGALRIAHLEHTFLSVEVTTTFPEDGTPLHVLVWNLSEEDHRDLQPYRPSVYDLVAFLRERCLVHALAHPLYRMGLPLSVATACSDGLDGEAGIVALPTDWTMPLPAYEQIELRFPLVTDVLARVEAAAPDIVHLATPGPIGITGLLAAKLLGIPVVGSYHTELGPYALQLTRDPVVAEITGKYVDWFYGQCDIVLAPTFGVLSSLTARRTGGRVLLWGRGVDGAAFGPRHRDEALRAELLAGGDLLLLSVGRVSDESASTCSSTPSRSFAARGPGRGSPSSATGPPEAGSRTDPIRA